MKIVKSALLALALVLPAGLIAQTDDPGGRNGGEHRSMPSVDDQVQHLTKELSLSDSQQGQVRSILQDQRDQMKKTMQDSSGSRQDSWSKMRDIHEQSSAKIREVLTDEQKTKYDKMQEERRQRGQQRRQNHEEAPPSNPQ